MRTRTYSKKYDPGKVNVTLSDGTKAVSNKNQYKRVKKQVHPVPAPDLENAGVKDEYSKLDYPPPKSDIRFREKWGRFIENISSRPNFKESQLDPLEILCDLYVELDDINKFLRTHGNVYKVITITGEFWKTYPEVKQRDTVRMQIQQYSKLLDLFPKKDRSPKGMNKKDAEEWE